MPTRFPNFKIIFISILLLFSSSMANSADHGAPATEHGAPASDHGAPAAKENIPAWIEVEARISSLEAKYYAKKAAVEKLIEDKNHLPASSPRLKEIVLELSKEHREMRLTAEELDKQRTIYRYRFPERGADPKRNYDKIKVQSLTEIESSQTIESRLQKVYQRAKRQYNLPAIKEKSVKQKEDHIQAKPREPLPEGSIILQK